MNQFRQFGPSFRFLTLCVWHAATLAIGQSLNPSSTNANFLREELIQAASTNNLLRVRAILKAQPALANATNNLQEPILVEAARQNNVESVSALLEAGAAADATGRRQTTALCAALEPVLRYGHSRRPDNVLLSGREALIATAQTLLQHGASIFTSTEYGQPLIRLVAQGRDADLLDFLLIHQRPPDSRDAQGNSTAHLAAIWGRTNALKALAQEKANLEATNAVGFTPLQALARLPKPSSGWISYGWRQSGLDADGPKLREATAQVLVALGASRDIFSVTALGWTNAARQLLNQEPEVARSRGLAGQTPLHWAAEFDDIEVARMLLEAGASAEAADLDGQTPLGLAAAKGHTDVARILVSSGASAAGLQGLQDAAALGSRARQLAFD